MKVHSRSDFSAAAVPGERETAGQSERPARTFGAELSKNMDDNYRERLAELLDKINDQGAKLSQNPTYSELRSYRNMVRNFIGEAVNRSYLLESRLGWDNRGRQKMYSVIKKVDDELAMLTEDVRVGQERQLSIMERLGAIRGMLVDLYI
ncbi:MAG: YaaR family protein [Acidaminococcales bacterium]|nr:YaaR family protein [Acidaminococcales bacterium]